jgi:hypothetical protein
MISRRLNEDDQQFVHNFVDETSGRYSLIRSKVKLKNIMKLGTKRKSIKKEVNGK